MIDFKDAGSAALDNPEALSNMRDIWQTNVQQMVQYVLKRDWKIWKEPTQPVGLTAAQLDALEATLSEPLPGQLRWLLSWAGEWQFDWRCADDEVELPDALKEEGIEFIGGGLRWSAQQLEDDNLREQLSGWVEHHSEMMEEDDEDEQTIEAFASFWQSHFPFSVVINGDLLTIDTRHPDPQQQPVRYFYHDIEGEDEQEGVVLAPNLFSFISRWTALGCIGMEWADWVPFVRGGDEHGLDAQGKIARQWLSWLANSQ